MECAADSHRLPFCGVREKDWPHTVFDACRHRQQLSNCDSSSCMGANTDAVPLRRVIQSNLSSTGEHKCSRSGQGLRDRPGCVHCVRSGWNLLLPVSPTPRFLAHDAPMLSDRNRDGRQFTFRHAFTGGGSDFRKLRGQVCGIALRLSRSHKCNKCNHQTDKGKRWRGCHTLEYVRCAILVPGTRQGVGVRSR